MEVQVPNVHDMRRVAEGFLDIAEFEKAVPVAVGAHSGMKEARILERVFCGGNGLERLIVHFDELRGVFGGHTRLRDDGGDGLTLIENLFDSHGVVCDFLADVGTELDEGLDEPGDFPARERAKDTWGGGSFLHAESVDLGMSVRGTDETDVQHAEHFVVV